MPRIRSELSKKNEYWISKPRGHSMKSRISEIGYAVMDLIEAYQRATASEFVRDPVCYALYQTWQKHDRARKEKEGDAIGR